MSIINEALKKLQDQISQNDSPHSSKLSSQLETLNEGPHEAMTEEPMSIRQDTPNQPPTPQNESHIVVVLMILCLLIGLFIPIVNKQSIISATYNHIVQQIKRPQPKQQQLPEQTVLVNTPSKTPIKEKNLSMPSASTKTVETPVVETPAVQTAVRTTPKKTQRLQSRLMINGTMTQGEKNLVLIDGQIYEEGDTVDGIKIIKVTPKGVTIIEDGQENFVKVMGI